MIAPTSVLQDPVGKTFSVLTTVCLQCILPPGMGCVLVALRRPWVWLFLPLKGRKDHNQMCVDLLLFSFGLFVSVCVVCVCVHVLGASEYVNVVLTCHGACVELRGQSWVLVLAYCLICCCTHRTSCPLLIGFRGVLLFPPLILSGHRGDTWAMVPDLHSFWGIQTQCSHATCLTHRGTSPVLSLVTVIHCTGLEFKWMCAFWMHFTALEEMFCFCEYTKAIPVGCCGIHLYSQHLGIQSRRI